MRGLCIEDLPVTSFPFLVPYLNQVRELDLLCIDIRPNCQCYLFKRCPSLEVLITQDICGDEGLQVIGQFCKKLRKLTHEGWVTHMGLMALAQACPNLDDLDVQLLDISNEALEYLPLDNGVRAMLMGCTKLKRLDLKLCLGGLTDVGLGYIGEYGHNLRHLSLSYTGESDTGLLELSKGCPKLRKLKLNGCPFSEQAIATFVFNINHSLRYIWVKRHSGTDLVLTRPMVSAESVDVRIAALSVVVDYFCLESSGDRARFQDVLPAMMQTRQLVSMLQIAEAESLEEGSRHLAIEFVMMLAEARERAPGMMRNLPISRFFAILMRILLDIDSSCMAFGEECG
ncbi:ACT domain-containing protein [Tanacetum coccineum]